MRTLYNKIGNDYDVTRKVDPEILHTFVELLGVKTNGKYLDIACGTGNYTVKFCTAGGSWVAFDQSEVMLLKQERKQVGCNGLTGKVSQSDRELPDHLLEIFCKRRQVFSALFDLCTAFVYRTC